MTEPGQPCPVCGVPDPGHDWDEHDRQAAGVAYGKPGPRGAERLTVPLSMLARSSSRGGAAVRWLAVHSTEGIMRAVDLRDWASWPGSSHAAADGDGVLLEPDDGFVPYERAAWTLRNGNPVSENIELCALAGWTRARWLVEPALLEACARWLAKRSKARGIPLRKLTVAQVAAGMPGVIDHDDYSDATGDGTHWDVGEAFPWDLVIPRARAIANPPKPPAPTPGGFMPDLTAAEQRELLDLTRDLHYGLRRPVIGGVTASTALREIRAGIDELVAQDTNGTPLTYAAAAGEGDEQVVPWTDEQVVLLGEVLGRELTVDQQRALVDALARS